jgi:hypothetical protein
MTDRTHSDARRVFVYIVKDTVFSDPEFPNRLHVFPGRDKSDEDFLVSRLLGRLMGQLLFDAVQKLTAVERTQTRQIAGNASYVLDRERDRSRGRSFVSALTFVGS